MEEYEQYSNGKLLKSRYSRIADLNEGSYGLVTVAKDTKNNRLVAVKFIYPLNYKKDNARASSSPANLRHKNNELDRQNTNEILKSLYEEAAKEISIHQILGSHPNISALYDHFDSYLVLEYCSRGDLYEAIQNGQGPTTSKDIKDVFYQILDALEYCHSHGVYHRDLKPENILIDDDWSLKLCDWGLATTSRKIYDKSEFDIGSERYMAPELFDTGLEYYDASKIDIWSIGIILLTIVFHKNPFEVANYSDKRFLQFATSRESLFDVFSTMTGDLFSVLRYCLNIDPNNRDLLSVRNELDILNYFSIDEEDWRSDVSFETDDESDLNHDYSELDDDTTVSGGDSIIKKHYLVPEPIDTKPSVDTVKVEDEEEEEEEEGDSTFYMDEDADNSNSTLQKDTDTIIETKEITPPKYNERAEALLSNNTSLKPIPINENFNGRSKHFKSYRKPIGVVSYNSYQTRQNNIQSYGGNNKSKFNREDFFTPKSVFNHYMTKYGEKSNKNNQYLQPYNQPPQKKKPDFWKKNNKPKTWKKNYRNTRRQTRSSSNNNYDSSSHNHEHSSSHNHEQSSSTYESSNYNNYYNNPYHNRHKSDSGQRKKSDSFSSSRSKAKTIINGLGTSYQSPSQSNYHGNSVSSNGKYIPPFMRSPNYVKSPNIAPLNEAIDNLNLNDYEVFQLEDDDFELENNNNNPTKDIYMNVYSDKRATDKHNFDKKYELHNDNDNINNNAQVAHTHDNAPNGVGRPMSLNNDSLASDSHGKYIPPFRRGSQSGYSSNTDKDHKRRSKQFVDFNNVQRISSPSSVPNSSTDWFSYRKDWGAYE